MNSTLCSTIRKVSPARLSSAKATSISRMRVGLTPATGSSSTTILGCGISAAASATSFFWP